MPTLGHFKRVIYTLKRRYGFPLEFYRESEESVDPKTGKRLITRIKHVVKKAIVIPQTASYLNVTIRSMMTYQNVGTMEIVDKEIIVDTKDFPKSYIPDLKDYVIYQQKRYEIKTVTLFDGAIGYYLGLREWKTSQKYEIFDQCRHDKLLVAQKIIMQQAYNLTLQDTIFLQGSLNYE